MKSRVKRKQMTMMIKALQTERREKRRLIRDSPQIILKILKNTTVIWTNQCNRSIKNDFLNRIKRVRKIATIKRPPIIQTMTTRDSLIKVGKARLVCRSPSRSRLNDWSSVHLIRKKLFWAYLLLMITLCSTVSIILMTIIINFRHSLACFCKVKLSLSITKADRVRGSMASSKRAPFGTH